MKYFIFIAIVAILISCSDSSNQPSKELEGKIVILHHNVVKGIIEDTDSIDISQGTEYEIKVVFNQDLHNDTLWLQYLVLPEGDIIMKEEIANFSGKEFKFHNLSYYGDRTYQALATTAKYYPINGVLSRTFTIFKSDTFHIEG